MIKKVLIANRGEIAVQIIRSLHEMDIKAVAIYSTADADSLFVDLADEAICVGGPNEAYLDMAAILNAAVLTGSDAIHPGYGFLSENNEFAELCEKCDVKFIGPSSSVIDLMGNKSNAKTAMKKNGVPTIPGSEGFLTSFEEAKNISNKIGYPVMLKAAAGGGGKGIRKVENDEELKVAYADTKRESKLSYGDDRLYLEKDINDAKHIEIQAIRDQFNQTIYFPERDCSLQRNHQKIIEESPSLKLSEQERNELGQIVVKAMEGINYENTGTFEFLMDNDHNFYFMEMNTRLQVEHTISEEVAQVELIKSQIMVANGDHLPYEQSDCKVKGYAIECRINAEDPQNNFIPQAGKIDSVRFPYGTMGVRIDSGIESGSVISPYYDSMIAKIIVHMPTKEKAVNKMLRALKEFEIKGVKTNRDFLIDLLKDPIFNSDDFNNNYIESTFLKEWMKKNENKQV